jgi:Ca2+-binding RTX toxin-like protein
MHRALPVAVCLVLVALALTPTAGVAGAPRCFGQVATIVRGDGDNAILGTPNRDVIVSGGGEDEIMGFRGNDLICAGPDADAVDAGPGRDKVKGGGGPDIDLEGGDGRDTLVGGGGGDYLFAQNDPPPKDNPDQDGNLLLGGTGPDKIYSQEGDDTGKGGGGDDQLQAGLGSDDLFGNFGNDSLRAYDKKSGKDLVDGGPDTKGDGCGVDFHDDRIDCEIILKN